MRIAEEWAIEIMSHACDHDDGYALCTGSDGCQNTAAEIAQALRAYASECVEAAEAVVGAATTVVVQCSGHMIPSMEDVFKLEQALAAWEEVKNG